MLTRKKQNDIYKPTNVLSLINQIKRDEKKEKRKTAVIAAAAISALAVSALIIAQ